MAPSNVAAWALKPCSRPLTVAAAPYIAPPKNSVVIKVSDVAINPIDWILQDNNLFHLRYPAIFGYDVAGEVHDIGEGVTNFRKGDRVIAVQTTIGLGGFQRYTVVPLSAVAPIPSSLSATHSVVLPLALTTAAAGLYQPDFLALPSPVAQPTNHNRVLLVWGGSSSVGSAAIQLARASGIRVITTASPRNFEFCRALGADAVFDYHSPSVEDDVVRYLQRPELGTNVGVFHAVGADSVVETCARIADRMEQKSIVVTVRGVPDSGIPESVRVKAISAATIFSNPVGPMIWRDFLPGALARGQIRCQPEPLVVGEGLRSVQHGLDVQRRGVSASKVVVTNIGSDA